MPMQNNDIVFKNKFAPQQQWSTCLIVQCTRGASKCRTRIVALAWYWTNVNQLSVRSSTAMAILKKAAKTRELPVVMYSITVSLKWLEYGIMAKTGTLSERLYPRTETQRQCRIAEAWQWLRSFTTPAIVCPWTLPVWHWLSCRLTETVISVHLPVQRLIGWYGNQAAPRWLAT